MYETLLFILHYVIDLYVPRRLVDPNRQIVPDYLARMKRRQTTLWNKATHSALNEDWAEYLFFSRNFDKALSRYNLYTGKKSIFSKDKSAFYRYIASRTENDNFIPNLRNEEGVSISSARGKTNLPAKEFQKVFYQSACSSSAFFAS